MGKTKVRASSAWEELRLLLKEKAILYADRYQPIKGRGGEAAPWMFYSWSATLTHQGARLAALCLLEKLGSFKATQLATFGYTGMPLVCACVLLGEGKYTGISVREARKAYGSSRRIEGNFDRNKPVVLIDDSISSGSSMLNGIQALEEEGLHVEGGVCLVNFPWRGGTERLTGLGYRIEALYDVWKDLEMALPPSVPLFKQVMPEQWGDIKIEAGLHPASAARRVAEIYLETGVIPTPPDRLDDAYQAPGGTFVSFRYREMDYRVAREGFWHFNPSEADPCRDLVLATVKTLNASGGKITLDELKKLKIAVTFFGPLEKVPPRKLDFSRFGIVVRSQAYEAKMGGALPNTQVFTNEVEQYYHARVRNARVTDFEPHDIYRHGLVKCVEPGEYWLPYGFPADPAKEWEREISIGDALTGRARECLHAIAKGETAEGEPVSDDLIPAPIYAVSVTLYHKGIIGCGVAWNDTLDACILKSTSFAFNDQRFAGRRKNLQPGDMGISVSILHDREWLGEKSVKEAVMKLRRGLDSLSVQQGERTAIFLPVVGPYYNWTKEQIGSELLRKAGITAPPYIWSTFKTATWLRRGKRLWKLTFGFPDRSEQAHSPTMWKEDISLLASYIVDHLDSDGLPEYYYMPTTGARQLKGTSPRILHAIWALGQAGQCLGKDSWRRSAVKGLRHCLDHLKIHNGEAVLDLPGQLGGAMADCILLAALASQGERDLLGEPFEILTSRIRRFFQPDGRITYAPEGRGIATDHDFFTGAALTALGTAALATGDLTGLDCLDAQLNWFQRRFRALHPWGMVGWHTQGWSALYLATGERRYADFVFEMADWALDWQHEKSGAFLIELHPYGPSFHTLFVAEGIADAWRLARLLDDQSRTERYSLSSAEALRFLNQILVRPEDTFCMVDPGRAVGGVRSSSSTSDVRIDYVSHSLLAATKAYRTKFLQKIDTNVTS